MQLMIILTTIIEICSDPVYPSYIPHHFSSVPHERIHYHVYGWVLHHICKIVIL